MDPRTASTGQPWPTLCYLDVDVCQEPDATVIYVRGEFDRATAPALASRLRPILHADPRCATNAERVAHREWLDAKVDAVFAGLTSAAAIDRLTEAQTAFGSVNSVYDLIEHPQLVTRRMPVGDRLVDVPASPWAVEWEGAGFAAAPALDEHGPAIRAEFAG